MTKRPGSGPLTRHLHLHRGAASSCFCSDEGVQQRQQWILFSGLEHLLNVMYVNHEAKHWISRDPADPEILPFHQRLPNFTETPLHRLPSAYCQSLTLGGIYVKDESMRCGLPAFKILGASWGAYRAITDHLGCSASPSLDHIGYLARKAGVYLYTASDGNHGRAVARIASILGVRASVYVPHIMLEKTRALIRQEGALVTVVDGDYDNAVRSAQRHAEHVNGILIQDTAWPGYEEIPKWIVQGYSTMMIEIDQQIHGLVGRGPDLVVVPVGVGSLAHAVVAHYKEKGRSCAILAVEPETAACLKTSLEKGQIAAISTADTSMCGLNCGTVSYTAWPYLCQGIDASITVSDIEAGGAQDTLQSHGIKAGPCAAATLAALTKVCHHYKSQLNLTEGSIVVLLATEGPG